MFCEMQVDPLRKYNTGWFSVASISLLVGIHLVNLLVDGVKLLFKKLKTYIVQKCPKKAKPEDIQKQPEENGEAPKGFAYDEKVFQKPQLIDSERILIEGIEMPFRQ